MSSFHFDVGEKRRSNRLAGRIRRALLRALQEEREEHGLTQQKLAEKLGVHRSVINRQLTGEANLTLKSLSELVWALNRDFVFELRNLEFDTTCNIRARSEEETLVESTINDASIWIDPDQQDSIMVNFDLYETAS